VKPHRFKNGLARDWLARKVSCSMRFSGHETVSIGNRVRVNAALNKVIISSILLSLFMTTAIYILPSKSFEKYEYEYVNTKALLSKCDAIW